MHGSCECMFCAAVLQCVLHMFTAPTGRVQRGWLGVGVARTKAVLETVFEFSGRLGFVLRAGF